MQNNYIKRVVVMLDSESLGLRPDSIVREIAFIAVDAEDPETVIREVNEYLPLLPQEALNRKCYVETVGWLAPERLQEIQENAPGDLDELCAIVRSIIKKFNEVTANREYEVWIRRPQHDVPMLESLFTMCGEALPWRYDRVMDLATAMDLAGIDYKTISNQGLDKHIAINDCKFQLRCYERMIRAIRVLDLTEETEFIGTITNASSGVGPSHFGVKHPELGLPKVTAEGSADSA